MKYITSITGTIFMLLITILVFIKCNQYDDIKDELDDFSFVKEYFDYCIIGFAFIDIFKIKYNGSSRKNIKNYCDILFGKQYRELMNYFFLGAQIAVLVYGSIISILLFNLVGGLSIVIFMIFCLIAYNLTYDLKIRVNTRNENIAIQLPSMISQLVLLINAGLVLRDAWEIVAYSQEKEIYKEMQYIQSEMENGVNEKEGLRLFAIRCDVSEIKKISTLLIQNLEQGGKDVANVLKLVVNDMWIQKKAVVRRKAQTASQKLLFPAAIVFVGILILIIVPLLTQSLL